MSCEGDGVLAKHNGRQKDVSIIPGSESARNALAGVALPAVK
jgi:hypothetical protein